MAEPVSLAEAKAQCRVEHDDEDDLIGSYIVSARELVEEFTGLVLVEREIIDVLDCFERVELSGWPLSADASVEVAYLDGDGEAQTVADHRLLMGRRPARLYPAINAEWPTVYRGAGEVTLTYTAGYADAASVPYRLKQAIKMLVAYWFHSREAVGEKGMEMPLAVEALCRPFRLPRVGAA